jgi:chromosome segregation ATPase
MFINLEKDRMLRVIESNEKELNIRDDKIQKLKLELEQIENLKKEMEIDIRGVLTSVHTERRTFESQINALNTYITKLEEQLGASKETQDFMKARLIEKPNQNSLFSYAPAKKMEEEISRLNEEVDRLNQIIRNQVMETPVILRKSEFKVKNDNLF